MSFFAAMKCAMTVILIIMGPIVTMWSMSTVKFNLSSRVTWSYTTWLACADTSSFVCWNKQSWTEIRLNFRIHGKGCCFQRQRGFAEVHWADCILQEKVSVEVMYDTSVVISTVQKSCIYSRSGSALSQYSNVYNCVCWYNYPLDSRQVNVINGVRPRAVSVMAVSPVYSDAVFSIVTFRYVFHFFVVSIWYAGVHSARKLWLKLWGTSSINTYSDHFRFACSIWLVMNTNVL